MCSICGVSLYVTICAVCASSFPIIVRLFYAPFSLVLISVVIFCGFLAFSLIIFMSFPIATMLATRNWNGDFFHKRDSFCSLFSLLDILLSWLPTLWAMIMLKSAAVGTLIFFQLVAAFVFSKHSLPFAVCCVAFSYFLWISYRSFTRKYQDLAVNLFEYYDMLTDSASERAFSKPYVYVWPAIVSRTPDHDHANDNVHVKRILKELFNMACDEVMPIRKGIYKLVVKTSLSMILIFVIFSFTMSTNAFLALTFAMIINIYLDRRKQTCNLNFEQKCHEIVREYIKRTPPFNRKRRNYMCSVYDSIHVFEIGVVPVTISYTCWMVFLVNWIRAAALPGDLSDLGYVISNI